MSNQYGISNLTNSLLNYFNAEAQLGRIVQVGFPDQNAPQETTLLYLYKVEIDDHYRNHVHGHNDSRPPVPIRLHYILVFNYLNQNEAQQELASLMRLLYVRPVLPKNYAESGSGALTDQFDPIRLAVEKLSLEDLTKLWTSFQTRFRLALPFTASVLMLDIEEKPADAMPILRRPMPGENIVVNPYLTTKITDVYGQLKGAELESNTRLSSLAVGHHAVFNISGGLSAIKAFEFAPTSNELSEPEKKLRTITIKMDLESEDIEQLGQKIRLKLPTKPPGPSDQSWLCDQYQVRAVITNPFVKSKDGKSEDDNSQPEIGSTSEESVSADKPPHFTSPVAIAIVPSLKPNNDGKFASIQNGVLTVELMQNLIGGTNSQPFKQTPTAILTQWKPKGESWEGNTPRTFEFTPSFLSIEKIEFLLNDNGAPIRFAPNEQYVLRIKIGDLVSQHYVLTNENSDNNPPNPHLEIDKRAVLIPGGIQ